MDTHGTQTPGASPGPHARNSALERGFLLAYFLLAGLVVPALLLSDFRELWPDFWFWFTERNLRTGVASGAKLCAVTFTAALLFASACLLLRRHKRALRSARLAMVAAMVLPFVKDAVIPYFVSSNPAELLSVVHVNIWLPPFVFYGCLLLFSNAPFFRSWPGRLPPLAAHQILRWYYYVWCPLYAVAALSYIRILLWPQYVSVGAYLATGTAWTSILMVLFFAHGAGSLLSCFLLLARHIYAVPCAQLILLLQIGSMALILFVSLLLPELADALAFETPPWGIPLVLCLFLLYFLWLGSPRRPIKNPAASPPSR